MSSFNYLIIEPHKKNLVYIHDLKTLRIYQYNKSAFLISDITDSFPYKIPNTEDLFKLVYCKVNNISLSSITEDEEDEDYFNDGYAEYDADEDDKPYCTSKICYGEYIFPIISILSKKEIEFLKLFIDSKDKTQFIDNQSLISSNIELKHNNKHIRIDFNNELLDLWYKRYRKFDGKENKKSFINNVREYQNNYLEVYLGGGEIEHTNLIFRQWRESLYLSFEEAKPYFSIINNIEFLDNLEIYNK